ncbi:MAG: metal ABC transporter permease [Planctomycetota bacterium]
MPPALPPALLDALLDPVTLRQVAVAATCNVSCALVGCFLVLRRISLMGDALSHAVLPGLVIALLVARDGGPAAMLVGAVGAGLATTFLTRITQEHGNVAADASLGVVYTTLFALGVVLVKRYMTDIHFDIACVYEGSLLNVAMNTTRIAGVDVPRAFFTAAPVLLAVVTVVTLLWKEWKVATFDPALAKTMGLAPTAMYYLLMTMVSVTVMTSFESIGSILVIAMLIAPGAAAQLLVDRLAPMLVVSAVLAVAATLLGAAAADAMNVSPAGAIAVAAGLLYAAAALFGPRYGVVSRLAGQTRLALRVRREDLLARLYRRREASPIGAGSPEAAAAGRVTAAEAVAICGGGWLGRRAVRQLLRRGQARQSGDTILLTDAGAAEGQRLVRSHRLWESYLVDEVGLQTDHVHDPAHEVEHFLGESIQAQIEEQIAPRLDRGRDPHGRDIPAAGGPRSDGRTGGGGT